MSITSLNYFGFVAVLLLLYYILPKKIQWIVLLLGSIGFYLTSDVRYIIFLGSSILITWFFGIRIQKKTDRQKEELKAEGLDRDGKRAIKEKFKKKKRRVLVLNVIILLGLLYVCKYTDFTLDNIKSLSKLLGFSFKKPKINIILPLGISFYTFQSIGYIMDVYNEKVTAEKNPLKYALFISFFPQIVQGPIARYKDLAGQLTAEHKFEFKNIKFGFELMLYGLFKKLVLADRIAVMVENVIFDDWSKFGRYELILAIVLYSIQIYADFSGCMDIITGIAKMFGIELSKNFDHPYFSKTIPEFWRRWHVSLGTWFKDYVFFPISTAGWFQNLNRKLRKSWGAEAGRIITGIIPIMVVWFLTGFWHGASWKYIAWGLYHGVLIALGMAFGPLINKGCDKLKIKRDCFSFRLFQMTRTFILCCIGRVFFISDGLKDGLNILGHIWTHNNPWVLYSGSIFSNTGLDTYDYVIVFVSILIVWAVSMMQERFKVREKLEEQNLVFRWAVVYAAIFIILIYGMYGAGLNTGDFLYRDF